MKFKDFLKESPLPDSWDKNKFTGRITKSTFDDMLAYALERARSVGKGSSRMAFKIDYEGRDTVLKVAINQKGIAQNKQESMYLNDTYIKKLGITIPIIDYDTDNFKPRWIHTEIADEFDESIFIKETGVELKDFVLFCKREVFPPKLYSKEKHEEISSKINKDSNLYKSFMYLLTRYHDLEVGDLIRGANWGIYKSKPVIIDIGFDSISKALYTLK